MDDDGIRGGRALGEQLRARVAEADWDAVVGILDQQWGLILADDPGLIVSTVKSLPPEVIAQNPRWAVAGNYVDRFATESGGLTTVFRGTPQTPEPESLLDVLALLTSKIASKRATGRFGEAAAGAAEARTLVDEADDASVATLQQALPELQYQWAMAWEYAGDNDRAAREYTDSYDNAVLIGHRLAEASAAGALAWLHAFAGRNIQARKWLGRLPAESGEWWESRASVTARFARTQLLVDELRGDEARDELSLASLQGVPDRWPAQKYLLALTENDPAKSLDLLTQIDSTALALPPGAAGEGAWAPFVALTRSMLFARVGNAARAGEVLDDVALRDDLDLGSQVIRLRRAATLLVNGDAARASRHAVKLIAHATGTPRVLVGALALRAAAALRSEDTVIATRDFAFAGEQAARQQLYLPLTLLPRADLRALLDLVPSAVPDPLRDVLLSGAMPDGAGDPFLRLTPRELSIVTSAVGRTRLSEIAADRFVSVNTVKTQLRSIYRKLGVNSLRAMQVVAAEHGYAPVTDD
ncbi:helix-turn-helix transcriptional regulator [Herbiconiux sp. CPCC 203407]|uniref:Helix-turn-helix transcriptional regulator n=1 Tax=Herbiconiux oxytropis TaxID=2970915 RepID=A0AA42BV64_9MICO|nr:helix-turn-helix transcriptional regulator [Herbiconiux oxytropis]MCS5723025.1 helix-turn-helix transcriptional regulator [Herbiconiux oxytropis]MCS5726906.1 helix-turn-helix transcriptional regulator [Herbiconiux oxytropis]